MAHDAAREHDGRNVGNIRRLVEDDLVARVAGGTQREVDRLRGTDRDQQLGRRIVGDAVQALEVAGQRLAELERPVVARVVGAPFAEALDARLHDRPGRVEVRSPHPEADDVVHRGEDVEEAADAGRRHGSHTLRQRTLGPSGGRSAVDPATVAAGSILGRHSGQAYAIGDRVVPRPASVRRLAADVEFGDQECVLHEVGAAADDGVTVRRDRPSPSGSTTSSPGVTL